MKKTLILLTFTATIALYFMAYLPGLHGKHFADDFGYIFTPYSQPLLHVFIDKNETEYAYRPVEKLFLLMIQKKYGEDTFPVHFTQALIHLFFCSLFYWWLRKKQYSRTLSFLGFSYLLLTQAAVHAVASNDTFSQIIAAFSGYCSVFVFIKAHKESLHIKKYLLLTCSLLLFAISLASKETGFAFLALLIIITGFELCLPKINFKNSVHQLLHLLPFIALVLLYFWIRNYLNLDKASFGSGRMNIHIGFNIISNIVLSVFQTLLPFSSVDFYVAVKNLEFLTLLPSLLVVMAAASIIVCPLFDKKYRFRQMTVLLLMPVTLFPVCIFNHVSELYVYTMLPVTAVALLNGSRLIIERLPVTPGKAFCVLLFCYVLINIGAIYSKVNAMRSNGEKTATLLKKINPYLNNIPVNGTLVLLVPADSVKSDYSIFKRHGLRLFEDGEMIFNRVTLRNDFKTSMHYYTTQGLQPQQNQFVLQLDKSSKIKEYKFLQ